MNETTINCYLVTKKYSQLANYGQNWVTCHRTKKEAAIFFWQEVEDSGCVTISESEDDAEEGRFVVRGRDNSFIAFYDDAKSDIEDGYIEDCGDFVIGFTEF